MKTGSRTYSFVIPHHNSPELLNRLLESIPQREDVEIIVVDDNSNENKRPQISRPDVQLICIDAEHTRGAGHARNVGLERVTGKWILFADADDFYLDGFLNKLDSYTHLENLDVLYFGCKSVDSDSLIPANRTNAWQQKIYNYDGSEQGRAALRYSSHTPWNKMISAKLVLENNLLFEEVPVGNDAMFALHVGYFAKNVEVLQQDIYVYTSTKGSITKQKRTNNKLLCTLQNRIRQNAFLAYVGHPEFKSTFAKQLRANYNRAGVIECLRLCALGFVHLPKLFSSKNNYISLAIEKKCR